MNRYTLTITVDDDRTDDAQRALNMLNRARGSVEMLEGITVVKAQCDATFVDETPEPAAPAAMSGEFAAWFKERCGLDPYVEYGLHKITWATLCLWMAKWKKETK